MKIRIIQSVLVVSTFLFALSILILREEERLDAAIEQQRIELEGNQAEFNRTLKQIQQDADDGFISQDEASDLILEAYKKSLEENRSAFENTVERILHE